MSRSSLTIFLLIMSFGILFAGCSAPEPEQSFDDFVFTEDDLARVHEIADTAAGSGSTDVGGITEGEDVTLGTGPQVLTLSGSTTSTVLTDASAIKPNTEKQRLYDGMRTAVMDSASDVYRVNNPFLNVRAEMNVSSGLVTRLDNGETLKVTEIPSAEWAKVKLSDGKEGYVAFRYLAKLTTEAKLPEEKKLFEGKYFVDFAFLNIRKDPSTQSEKVGELPGQAIVKPLSMNGEWARVTFEGKEGYVSSQYLKPFVPVFLVRQDDYTLPILQYNADDTASITALPGHMAMLKASGKKIVTLKSLYDIVVAQETRDARVAPDSTALTIIGVNAGNIRSVTDALQSANVVATLFLETKDVGVSGITEKTILTILANGDELQSAGHTGDDLRSLTDSQVMLELGQSKKLIEDITRREVYAVAYPHGGTNDRVMQKAAEMGYLFGMGQSPDKKFSRTQFLRLPALIVSSGMTAEDVVKLVK